jgi:hypothetical protein
MRKHTLIVAALVAVVAAIPARRASQARPGERATEVMSPEAQVRAHHEASLDRHRALEMTATGEELRRIDREMEMEGLELKRRLAEERGDVTSARAIEDLIARKRATSSP